MKAIYALYADGQTAQQAINRLRAAGVPHDQITVLSSRPMEEFENSMKVLLRLSNRQRARVPVPPGHDASRVRAT